jgi:hypothetical protein
MFFLAAPIAFTLADVIVAATVAATTGYATKTAYDHFTDRDKKSEHRGEKWGEAKAKAEYDIKLRQFENRMERFQSDQKTHLNVIQAAAVVGYAYAAARHGGLTDEIRDEINAFVSGAIFDKLPLDIRTKLDQVARHPLDAANAYRLAQKASPDAIDLCDLVIDMVRAMSEPSRHTKSIEEKEFLANWERLKAAA